MWQTVLEKSPHQQQEAIHNIFYSKQYTLPQIIKNLQQSYEKLQSIFLKNWKFVLNIIFNHLSTEDCILYMKDGQNTFIKVINLIHRKIKRQERLPQFSKFYTKFNIIQKNLVILKSLSDFYFQKVSQNQLAWLLPDFIKTSASIIQKYLKLKSEAPKFQTDYIEHGNTLIIHTQNWVKNCYIKMAQSLPELTNKNQKNGILVCFSDMIGALLQVQLQKLITSQIVDQILESIVGYCCSNYSVDQINNLYKKQLSKHNYMIKRQKIFIADIYTDQKVINKEGFAYLMFRFIKDMAQTKMFTSQKIFSYVASAINQLSPFQHSFKNQLVKYVKTAQLHKIQNIPISVFMFNLHINRQKNKEIYDNFFKQFISLDGTVIVNSLIFLLSLQIENQQKQKQAFILQVVQKLQICESLVILLRKIDFEANMSQKQVQIWMDLCERVVKKYGNNIKNALKKKLQQKKGENVKRMLQLLS